MEGKEKGRERNINVWLLLAHPPLGTWPTTQVCVLTGNQTSDPLVCRPALNPLSHTSQGSHRFFSSLLSLHTQKYSLKCLVVFEASPEIFGKELKLNPIQCISLWKIIIKKPQLLSSFIMVPCANGKRSLFSPVTSLSKVLEAFHLMFPSPKNDIPGVTLEH